jgi:predicted RNA polymerase sigma factor
MCCHPSLTPATAIPLTLRAVGGLTTREIAAAFLVPEATMAQRISRAKAKLRGEDVRFALPTADDRDERLRSVLHVLYLLFNEGYATSAGTDLARSDLSGEAIRLTRSVRAALPDEPEVMGLLSLMLLNDARRAARTGPGGELVALSEQDRTRWNRDQINEGVALITAAMRLGAVGEYQLQAAIAAVHDQAPRYEATNWSEIASLYGLLERMTRNPMVTLNRAVAVAMHEGPEAGLDLLRGIDAALPDHHRVHAVRGHLLEMSGDRDGAVEELVAAAARTGNQRERHYLLAQAGRLRSVDSDASSSPDQGDDGPVTSTARR